MKMRDFNKAMDTIMAKVGHDRLHVGNNRIFMGPSERYVNATLATSGIAEHYDRLVLTLFISDVKSNSVEILLTDPKYAPPKAEWSNPNIGTHACGYFWSCDMQFYNYIPRPDLISKEVDNLLAFWKVGPSVTVVKLVP